MALLSLALAALGAQAFVHPTRRRLVAPAVVTSARHPPQLRAMPDTEVKPSTIAPTTAASNETSASNKTSASNETSAVAVADPAVTVSKFDEWLIEWGLKEDPRVPEECRVSPMERIKSSGRAGIAAYTITEFAFWLSSVPLAIALIRYETGALPDVTSTDGQTAVAGYVFAFTTFARTLVPVRIGLALALAPWCDRNIIQRFFAAKDEECDAPGDGPDHAPK